MRPPVSGSFPPTLIRLDIAFKQVGLVATIIVLTKLRTLSVAYPTGTVQRGR